MERSPNLLSKHGLGLLCVARNPDSRLREIGDFVGVTERAAHTLVSELAEAGYLERERIGTRNRYKLRTDTPLPDPGLDGRRLGELLEMLGASPSAAKPRSGRDRRSPKQRTRRRA